MIDAYTIGITLALDNGVAAGIETIRRDLAAFDKAVANSELGLHRLQTLAAELGLRPLPAVPRPAAPAPPPNGVPASATEPAPAADAPVIVPTRTIAQLPQAAPLPSSQPAAPEAPLRAASPPQPRSPGLSTPAPKTVNPVLVRTQTAPPPQLRPAEPPRTAAPRAPEKPPVGAQGARIAARDQEPAPAPPERDAAPPSMPARPADRPTAPAAPVVSPGRLLPQPHSSVQRRTDLAGPPQAPVHKPALRHPHAAARPQAASRKPEGDGARITRARAPDRQAGSSPRQAASAPRPAARPMAQSARFEPSSTSAILPRSAAPPARAARETPGTIEVYLDADVLARWIDDHLARAALRPFSGTTGFDPRISPTWSGPAIAG